jgi:hypothetical protein
MNCFVEPNGKSNSSVTDCVGGSASGLYNSGNIVRLVPQLSTAATTRGWHFDHWTDSTAGGGQIDCDPQGQAGDFSSPTYCEFAIYQDLQVDLWFRDDTGPQDTAITGGPTGTTSQTSATFTSFSAASDPDATFQCRLDQPGSLGSWGSCPKTGATFSGQVVDGTYTLSVRAVDPSGNLDLTPASRTWTVDRTPPTVHLTGGPPEGSATNAVSADFGVSTSDGTLVCTIDGATLASCTPPSVHLAALGDGQHTFSVRGVDAIGNSSTPITRTWTVDTKPPTVTLSGGPSGTTRSTSAQFSATASDGIVACTLDGAPTACEVMHDGLADGPHTFTATATDAAGNTSAAASRSWTVDATPPGVTIVGAPAWGSTTSATSATLTFASDDATATFRCKLDRAAFAPCTSPLTVTGLAAGVHDFSVLAVDAAGNTSIPESRSWNVGSGGAGQSGGGGGQSGGGGQGTGEGGTAPLARVPGRLSSKFSTAGAKTTIVTLKLTGLTAPRTTVTVTCKGKGCPFTTRRATAGKSHTVDVRALLKKAPLKAGQKLTIKLSAPGHRAAAATFTFRRGRRPAGGTLASA